MVIKAQVLAGGRGLGTFENGFKGGVHVGVKTPAAIKVGVGVGMGVGVGVNVGFLYMSEDPCCQQGVCVSVCV